jgi:hypothetical protein
MHEKNQRVGKYWGGSIDCFKSYRIDPEALMPFSGSHPAVVLDWLANEAESQFAPDPTHKPSNRERRHRWMMKLERVFGLDLSHKHYTLAK